MIVVYITIGILLFVFFGIPMYEHIKHRRLKNRRGKIIPINRNKET